MSAPAPGLEPREAVSHLFESHGDRIYRLGLRVCDDPQTAEDLVQETFLRALDAWESFEGRSKPSTWLYTIATRTCHRMRRRRAGEPARVESLQRLLPSGDEGLIQVPSADDPQRDVAVREVADVVRDAVAGLPPDFRIPVVLKEMFDFSLEEIARVLEIKEATVKTRLHRGRLRIRKALAERLPSEPPPPLDHAREECLALLVAKQESLDRGTPFPVPEDELCERCRSVFSTLDLGREACRSLRHGRMPEALRREVAGALSGHRPGDGNLAARR
ncbi:MAG: RNA polymerase sigma factor [Gemmatimonadota bacterium]|nr:RNA polymerase sigma factor [Gemmatimonadota bacterium]